MITHPARADLAGRRRVPMSATAPYWAGRKVLLREIDPADRRTLVGFDRDSAPQLGGYRHWAAHRATVGDAGDDFQFAIETLRGGVLVGSMCVTADPDSDVFSYGIGIAPQHQRCGYAADAITVLLAYVFGQRGYRKCEVSIYGGNLASLALHGSLGFREESRLRDTELLRGQVKYPVTMGITADEFAAFHPELTAPRPRAFSRRGRHWRRRRGRHWNPQYLD